MTFSTRAAAIAAILLSTANAAHYIDPNSVNLTTKESWCSIQETQCPYLCSQYHSGFDSQIKTCDPTTLNYTCICTNGITPNASEFSLTLDYFICQAWGAQCKDGCNGQNACISKCDDEMQCGAQSPRNANDALMATTSSSSAVTTAAVSANTILYSGLADGVKDTAATGAVATATATLYSGLAGEAKATATTGAAAGLHSTVTALTFGVAGVAGALSAGFALLL